MATVTVTLETISPAVLVCTALCRKAVFIKTGAVLAPAICFFVVLGTNVGWAVVRTHHDADLLVTVFPGDVGHALVTSQTFAEGNSC